MNAEWIDASSKKPPRFERVLGFRAGYAPCICYVNRDGDWFSDEHCNVYNLTHWMRLPEPPKRESSFEQWWRNLGMVGCTQTEKENMRRVWESAVAASKQPDFVE